MEKLAAHKGMRLLALIAVLALAITVAAAPVGASGDSGATVAKNKKKKAKKKKCKKGFKLKKIKKKGKKPKKKCVKKKKKQQQSPLVRATISWANADAPDADLDLFVFDANGNIAAKGSSAIPNSSISPDVVGTSGSETFTDRAPQPLRTFSFGVCYQVGGSAHAPFTIIYVTADGQSHTDSEDPGSSFHYDYPGGAPIPAGYCPD